MEEPRLHPLSHKLQVLLSECFQLGRDRKWNVNNPRGPHFERLEFLTDERTRPKIDAFISTLYQEKLIPENLRTRFEAMNPWFTFYRLVDEAAEISINEALVFPLTQGNGNVSLGGAGESWKPGQYIEIDQRKEKKLQMKVAGDVMVLIVGYEPIK